MAGTAYLGSPEFAVANGSGYVYNNLEFQWRGGTVTVIHEDGPGKYSVAETVQTLPKAKTSALDPKTHQMFLSTAEGAQFEVLVVGNK